MTDVMAATSFTDIRGLQQLKAGAARSTSEAGQQLEKVASAFESLFVDMWIKSMREAGAVFSEGSYLSSDTTRFHQEMLDHQWAVELSAGGGLGLRDVIVRQLGGLTGTADGAPAEGHSDGPHGVGAQPPDGLSRRHMVVHAAPVEHSVAARSAPFAEPREFVTELLPAIRAGLQGTPLNPLVVLAQAALETGWGSAVLEQSPGRSSHNLFGIKAASDGDEAAAVIAETREFIGGRFVNKREPFRTYPSWVEAVRDYAALITGSERYSDALEAAKDPAAYADALRKGGYATDPDYPGKILRVLERVQELIR